MSNHDKQGREWARLSQLKDRSVILSDGSDSCMRKDIRYIVFDNGDGKLYTMCKQGRHFLDGNTMGSDDHDHCVGIYNAEQKNNSEQS